jgi:hypothetical protein
MKKKFVLPAVVMGLILSVFGCAFFKGWQMDYGKVKAQFEEVDLAKKGEGFIGEKVTVRGVVKRVDLSDEGDPKVFLAHGTQCHFGKMLAMAKGMQVGETVYIDGFLEKCEDGEVVLKPAMSRDPKAPFNP